MRERQHLAQHLTGGSRAQARRPLRAGYGAMWLTLALGLAGCHHKAAFVLPASAHAPVELETVPPPETPPMIATLPPPELGSLPPRPPARPTPRRPTPAKETPTPPPQVAAAEPAAAIGALSSGGDSVGQSQQQAKDLIASILKRIAALPAKTADSKKGEVRQVKRFLGPGTAGAGVRRRGWS